MDKSFCEICMKNYASYRSLWNHNNKFHSDKQNIKDIKDNKSINKDNKSINEDNKSININNFDKLQCKNKKSRFVI